MKISSFNIQVQPMVDWIVFNYREQDQSGQVSKITKIFKVNERDAASYESKFSDLMSAIVDTENFDSAEFAKSVTEFAMCVASSELVVDSKYNIDDELIAAGLDEDEDFDDNDIINAVNQIKAIY